MEITAIVINPRMGLTQKKQLLSKHKNMTVVYDTSVSTKAPVFRDKYGSSYTNIERVGK